MILQNRNVLHMHKYAQSYKLHIGVTQQLSFNMVLISHRFSFSNNKVTTNILFYPYTT